VQFPPNERVADGDFGSSFEAQFRDVLANQVGRRVVLLDQGGPRRSAADRFQRQGARAGKEIDRVSSADFRPDEVENRLAEAVFHWPGTETAAVVQMTVAEFAADDP
jgi:hypothetical protein